MHLNASECATRTETPQHGGSQGHKVPVTEWGTDCPSTKAIEPCLHQTRHADNKMMYKAPGCWLLAYARSYGP